MRTLWRCGLLATLLVASVGLLGEVFAAEETGQPAGTRLQRSVEVISPSLLSPTLRSQALQQIMTKNKLSTEAQQRITKRFRELPNDLQIDLLAVLDAEYSVAALDPDRYLLRYDLSKLRERLRLFNITQIWPSQGVPNTWSYVFGNGLNGDCVAYFDGTATESIWIGEFDEFFPNTVAFRVPAGATRGADHQVKIHNNVSGNETAEKAYRVVAPRGYRGYYGWQFGNFGDPTIPWAAYRHYFGASNVEYGDGTHRPAAQAYYDSTYKGAGGGGNCFGMSVSSLREKNGQRYTFQEAWFAGHPQTWLWWYPWQTETKQTVQESQGGWYTNETLNAFVVARDNQTPRDVYNRVVSLLSNWQNKPILVFWWPGAGHAVVPYKTNVAGDDRQIMVWDNNNPYRENETGSEDPNIFHIAWAANTADYGGPKTVQCLSYDECTPPTPHLPGAQYGGPGANLVVAVLEEGTRASQITDEAGRFFYNPDGTPNENPNTRIPFSVKLDPLVAETPGPVLRLPLPNAEVLTLPGVLAPLIPKSFPGIYLFGSASGKSLTFDLQADNALSFLCFQNGLVSRLQGTGGGQLRMNMLLRPERSMEVLDTAKLLPTSSEMIRSFPNYDRSFLVHDLKNLGGGPLRFAAAQDGASLQVQGPPELRFNLDISGPVGQGMQQVGFADLALAENALALLAPTSWGALGTSSLRLELRNLQTNQVLQTKSITRINR